MLPPDRASRRRAALCVRSISGHDPGRTRASDSIRKRRAAPKAARFFCRAERRHDHRDAARRDDAAIAAVEAKIRAHGLDVHVSRGTERTLIGAIGDERKLDPEMFEPMDGVEKSMHIVKPYKLVAREWHKANTVDRRRRHADRRQDDPGDRRARARSRRDDADGTRRPAASRRAARG